ncbi:dual specificity phosphatase, catalytic domain-containing protein [Sarocladium implicatum]|nr:dual specificity phosphatase, catalytic domain-containing protein [Sarocladium implicatum]
MEDPNEAKAHQRLAPGVEATAGYDLRAPSPPLIPIPMSRHATRSDFDDPDAKNELTMLDLEPTQEAMHNLKLSVGDLEAIVGDRRQVASNSHKTWSYENRRGAHPILDFLYVGPSSIVRDHDFLAQEGITMILVANATRMPGQKLKSVEAVGEALGVQIAYIDPEPAYQQVSSFNETLRLINDHMLSISRREQPNLPEGEKKRGKVLIVCETGNDRSGTIAASYIMAMYSRDMFDVMRYVLSRRLSCGFDDNNKRALVTWGDILKARSAVASHAIQVSSDESLRTTKRAFAETVEVEMEDSDDDETPQSYNVPDHERFVGREAFTPFRDAT